MDFRLIYSEASLADLEEISASSWRDHAITAGPFLENLLEHIELLTRFPWMGTQVRRGVRRIHHSPFNVYYLVREHRLIVEILRVLHAARRQPTRF